MKTLLRTVSAVALSAGLAALAVPANAGNLIVNGTFSTPNVGNSWSIFSNGHVPGWTSNNDETEIDHSPTAVGMPCINAGCQNLELNGNTFDTISQTVTGLTPGVRYTLSWDYGDRPGAGAQEADILFGGVVVGQDSTTGMTGGQWMFNHLTVIPTSTSEVLSFEAISVGGNRAEGNEIANVSLVPEPVSLALLGAGIAGLGLIRRRRAG
jgi:hypothetical protein